MSSTPTTATIPPGYWSARRYAIAVALVLALVIAAFGAGSLLTGSDPASSAAVEEAGAGTDANSRGHGLGESQATDDGSGTSPLRGRIQP